MRRASGPGGRGALHRKTADRARGQAKIAAAQADATADYLPAWVAQEEGMFQKRGLETSVTTVVGSTILPGLQAGSLQIAGVPPAATLTANEGGLDLVAVAGASVSSKNGKNYALLVLPDSGISTAKDLAGKKIGVSAINGMLYIMARKYATDQGAPPGLASKL